MSLQSFNFLSNMKSILFVLLSLNMLVNGSKTFKLSCSKEKNACSLTSTSDGTAEMKVKTLKCVDSHCQDAIVVADNNHWFICQFLFKNTADCEKVFNSNTILLQDALWQLINSRPIVEQAASSGSEEMSSDDYGSEAKRSLPFETLNYGRRKRQLPFETLNYGKRSLPFETLGYGKRDLPFETLGYGKRSLPFETLGYGKRDLPFETLGYGKRSYIPIDGYIMGKRQA